MKTIEEKIVSLPSLKPESLNEIIKGMYQGKPLLGPEGLLTQIAKDLTQLALQGEIEAHLSECQLEEGGNRRNGVNSKVMKSAAGSFELDVPRDRNLNLAEMLLHTRQYDTINGSNVIDFLSYLQTVMPVGVIHVILDQARYHTCKEVKEWLVINPRVCLHYLPPYSPNLNSIEPCWKVMHEHTTNNLYHPTFRDFTEKIETFLHYTFPAKAREWTDRLTDNFRIMGGQNAT